MADDGQQHGFIVADFQDPAGLAQGVQMQLDAGTVFHILVNNTGGPPGGEMNVALMLDLSRGGVKFSGNQHVINSMFPENEAPLGVVLDVFINIHFNLSEDESPESIIKTGARVIHTERLAQDLFQVGVEFIDLTEAAKKSLQDFIGGCQEE